MPFTDYFLAPDDTIAVTALTDGGPVSTSLPTVEAKNVDPVVNLGNLESILTARPYDEVLALPRQGSTLTSTAEFDQVIIAVTDSLRDALTAAPPTTLDDAGTHLAATEELAGIDPPAVIDFVHRLAGLARQANGWHMYCYWAL
ncbi:hypothetical protein [Paractinoplanes lichenicola]|uniref:Uncharacterized protein n=1 Tax=Paractinoplanes lichenicola TaxID=2802976 RepID=A0ABS1W575_9ACTN|nr:hypothetical protein [Actinoplanes lichenicola]MBL7261890.1 hypothetical protein [Actinoplanes lichenicola]